MSCPHFHSQVSGRLQGGDDDDLGGRAEKGLGEVEACSDKRPSGGDVLTGSEVLNHKPPFMGTEQFEARKKEMVKTLMAGIGIARDQDLDDDKLEDPLSRVRIRPAGVGGTFLSLVSALQCNWSTLGCKGCVGLISCVSARHF